MEIYLFYDARPFVPDVKAYKCEVIKRTKTGFKIKNLDSPSLYEDVICYPDGSVRGWGTLSWEHVYDAQAQSDYETLRKRMQDADELTKENTND